MVHADIYVKFLIKSKNLFLILKGKKIPAIYNSIDFFLLLSSTCIQPPPYILGRGDHWFLIIFLYPFFFPDK